MVDSTIKNMTDIAGTLADTDLFYAVRPGTPDLDFKVPGNDIRKSVLGADIIVTAAGRALIDDADAATQRATLGVVIGTDVQAFSSVLQATTASFLIADKTKLDGIEALADVTDTANVTASGALMDSEVDANLKTLVLPASTTISAFGASLVDDADAAAARTTLGLGAGDSPVFTGLSATGLTTGSILFAGASGVLSQNNTNIFWDNTNNRLGIGTVTPAVGLEVSGETSNLSTIRVTRYGGSNAFLQLFRANGTEASPTTILSGESTGSFRFGGFDGTTFEASAVISAAATENWSATARGSKIEIKTIPNGTTTKTLAVTIGQDQKINLTNYGAGMLASDASGNITSESIAWASFTPVISSGTGGWTNVTLTGFFRVINKMLEVSFKVAFTGASATVSQMFVSLPSGLTIDTAVLAAGGGFDTDPVGIGILSDSGTTSGIPATIHTRTSTKIMIKYYDTSGSFAKGAQLTQALPFVWANVDNVVGKYTVPIV